MKSLFIVLLMWICTISVWAQKTKPNSMEAYQREMLSNRNADAHETEFSGLIIGYQGGHNHFFEAGWGQGFLVSSVFFGGIGPSVELNLKDKVNGYKLGIWINSLLSFGANALLYHNYDNDSPYYNKLSLGLRPDIGLGISVVNVTYGYNFLFNNPKMSGVNKHMISIRCMIPVIKK